MLGGSELIVAYKKKTTATEDIYKQKTVYVMKNNFPSGINSTHTYAGCNTCSGIDAFDTRQLKLI